MSNALTINQEKQIRAQRQRGYDPIALYLQLAKHVALYRRAQKLTTKEASEVRKDLLTQIDACLEKLGLQ